MSEQLEIKLLEPSQNPLGTDFCRLCLEGQPGLISLKCHIGEVSVPKMFSFLTGLEIDFDDDYPKVACSSCFTRLELAYQTRKDFLDNFQTLMSMTVLPCVDDKDALLEESVENDGTMIVLKEELLSGASDVELVPEVEKKVRAKRKTVKSNKTTKATKTTKTTKRKRKAKEDDSSTEKSDGEEHAEAAPAKKKKPREKLTKEEHRARRKLNLMDRNKCYICQEVFADVRQLNVHLPQHTDMLPYTCQLCVTGNGPQKEKISSLVLLHRHVRMHSGHVPCPKCPYKLFSINLMYNHVKHAHSDEGKLFICEKCGMKLTNRNAYLGHKMRHKYIEEGRYTCAECGAKFGNKPRLERHMLGHKEKEFECQYCEKRFPSKTLLLAHERTHSGKPIFVCVTCEEQFPSREKRLQHINDVHPEVAQANRENEQLHYGKKTHRGPRLKVEKDDVFPCDYDGCDYVGRTYGNLHYHKEKHRLRFMCQLCPKRFPTRQFLRAHLITHTGEKAFMCDQCDKSYTQIGCLKRHQIVHMKDPPKSYQCPYCPEAFVTKPRLDNHVLRHSEPQHHCDYCQRTFRYKGDWTRHMKQHDEGKLVGPVAKIEEIF